MNNVTDLSQFEMPQLEFDCTICGEKHASGDHQYETHRLYRKGDERPHVHQFTTTAGAAGRACWCGSFTPFL